MTLSDEDNPPGLAMVMLKTAKLFLIHMTDVAQLALNLFRVYRFTLGYELRWWTRDRRDRFCGECGESWNEQYSAKPWR
jgi:hypothetical protein